MAVLCAFHSYNLLGAECFALTVLSFREELWQNTREVADSVSGFLHSSTRHGERANKFLGQQID